MCVGDIVSVGMGGVPLVLANGCMNVGIVAVDNVVVDGVSMLSVGKVSKGSVDVACVRAKTMAHKGTT